MLADDDRAIHALRFTANPLAGDADFRRVNRRDVEVLRRDTALGHGFEPRVGGVFLRRGRADLDELPHDWLHHVGARREDADARLRSALLLRTELEVQNLKAAAAVGDQIERAVDQAGVEQVAGHVDHARLERRGFVASRRFFLSCG